MKRPPQQAALLAQCFYPSAAFVEFPIEEIDQSISGRFEQQVARSHDLVAVRSRSRQITYGNLNKNANRIARAILAQRGEKEEPIALLLDHDAAAIAAIIGVMKSGKTCVPLETASPPSRSRAILESSETRLLVTDNNSLSLAQAVANSRVNFINIDELDCGLADENIGLHIPADTLAYILYTSGSTGQPKGVTQTHRNALHSAMAYINTLHIQSDDRLTLLGPCSGAQGMKVAISALTVGATLCSWNIREEGLSELADWLINAGVTVYISSATVFRSFVATLRGTEQFPSIRIVRIGNEPVRRADFELYRKHFSQDCFLVNWFAATETGSLACYFIDDKTKTHGELVPVGYVFDDTEVLLLDDEGRQVGFNHIGEIAVRSRYLSPGYRLQPELTRAKFLPDPTGGEARVFLSGDLGFMLPDGCLFYVGRKDFQVKIRGNRIEVGEVESALLALDAIKDAVVIATDRAGDKRLVAYFVPAENSPPDVATLRRALAENLPAHMIPSNFVLLDAMPLTPNGKIDRRALPEPGKAHLLSPLAYVAPRTPFEEILAKIWADTLDIKWVGIHDNFFELGGDSLLATRVVSQVIKHFEVDLTLQSLFHSPTVAEMAAEVSQFLRNKLGEKELVNAIAEMESLTEEEAKGLLTEAVSIEPRTKK